MSSRDDRKKALKKELEEILIAERREELTRRNERAKIIMANIDILCKLVEHPSNCQRNERKTDDNCLACTLKYCKDYGYWDSDKDIVLTMKDNVPLDKD